MSRHIITGIDAGSSMIRVVVAEESDGVLNILAINQRPSAGIKYGYVFNLDDAAKSIKETMKAAEKLAGVPIKKTIISMGGISLSASKAKGSIMISKADGDITDHDVSRVINQSEANLTNTANKHVICRAPLCFKVDNGLVQGRPQGIKGAKLETETIFVTCLKQHAIDSDKAVEIAGITVDDIIAAPLATAESVLTKQQKEVGCVLVSLGASTVSMIVFENGLPFSLEVFPIGSSHITNDIALGFQVSLDEAEKLKFNFGSDVPVSKRRLSEIIEARLNDIFDLVAAHLKKINRNEMLPGGIILTGGGAGLFNLEEIAKSSLRLPAKIGTIKSNPSLNISAPSSIKDQILDNPGWSTALGLCIMGASENSYNFGADSRLRRKISEVATQWFRSLIP